MRLSITLALALAPTVALSLYSASLFAQDKYADATHTTVALQLPQASYSASLTTADVPKPAALKRASGSTPPARAVSPHMKMLSVLLFLKEKR